MRTRAAWLLLVAACSSGTTMSPGDALAIDSPPLPSLDPISVDRGRQIYDATCAVCHGAQLEGAEDWRTPDSAGRYPPPPHDSSGHTWHHSDQVLFEIITDPAALGLDMPALGLDPDDIDAVLDYLKSSWGPDERLYQWDRTHADSLRAP